MFVENFPDFSWHKIIIGFMNNTINYINDIEAYYMNLFSAY